MDQLFYINGENISETEQKVLSLCIGEKYIGFSITDFPGCDLTCVGYFKNEDIDSGFLTKLFSEHDVLNRAFHQVLIEFDNSQHALIPKQYHNNNSRLILRIMTGGISNSEIVYDELSDLELCNVYAVPGNVYSWLKQKYSSVSITHFSTCLFNSFIKSGIHDTSGCFLLDFKAEEFSVIAIRDKNILLTQYYSYSNPGDVVYYLLKICDQFSISQKKVELFVSGLIGQQSALSGELYQFFQHLTFRNVPEWDEIISKKSDYYSHYFASLNDLAKCAS